MLSGLISSLIYTTLVLSFLSQLCTPSLVGSLWFTPDTSCCCGCCRLWFRFCPSTQPVLVVPSPWSPVTRPVCLDSPTVLLVPEMPRSTPPTLRLPGSADSPAALPFASPCLQPKWKFCSVQLPLGWLPEQYSAPIFQLLLWCHSRECTHKLVLSLASYLASMLTHQHSSPISLLWKESTCIQNTSYIKYVYSYLLYLCLVCPLLFFCVCGETCLFAVFCLCLDLFVANFHVTDA